MELTEQAIDALSSRQAARKHRRAKLIEGVAGRALPPVSADRAQVRGPRGRPAVFPSPETDRHPAAAGSRYYVHASSAELRDAFSFMTTKKCRPNWSPMARRSTAKITEIDVEKDGKKDSVYWTVESDGTRPLRLREGSRSELIGCDRRHIEILD